MNSYMFINFCISVMLNAHASFLLISIAPIFINTGRGGRRGVRGAEHPVPEAGHPQPQRDQPLGRQLCRRLPCGGF